MKQYECGYTVIEILIAIVSLCGFIVAIAWLCAMALVGAHFIAKFW